MQTLQELVDAAIQSDAPHHHQLVLAPSWLTGAGRDPQEVWLALETLGKPNTTETTKGLRLSSCSGTA